MNRKLKKVIVGICVTVLLLAAGAIAFTIFNKDKIINYFIEEANKNIDTPIEVGKIDISVFNDFPNISVTLQKVLIKESLGNHQGDLAKVKSISFSLNPFELLQDKYEIIGMQLKEAEVMLMITESGKVNYRITQKDTVSDGSIFNLKSIQLKDVQVSYHDYRNNQYHKIYIKNATSDISQLKKNMQVRLKGQFISDEIRVGERVFFDNKTIDIKTHLDVDLENRIYTFKRGELGINKGKFNVQGFVNDQKKELNLHVEGVNTSFQTINSLLSKDISRYLNEYKSKGEVYFSSSISGKYAGKSKPRVQIEFGSKNASFYHPKYKKQLTEVDLKGYFDTGRSITIRDYELIIDNFSCKLDGRDISGKLTIRDFDNFKTNLELRGEADVNSVLLLFPRKMVKTSYGNLSFDIHITGELKNPQFTRNFNADGDISLRNFSMVLAGKKLPFNKVNGDFSLRNNDLAISDLKGWVGHSDFVINGFVKNASRLLVDKRSSIQLMADLESKYIDFDELLKSNFASRDTTVEKSKKYEFKISPRISVDFNCKVGHLKFERFHGREIRGNLNIHDQRAILDNVAFRSMGGSVNVSGSVNAKRASDVEAITEASLYNINIDSVFYVFKNFRQTWLQKKNLKGQVDADVNLYLNLDRNLVLRTEKLRADINTSIINGELNDFEPMMKLSRFVEEESLAQMRFSRMTNQIRIEKGIIYIPEMEIKSNVSNILVQGEHAIDGRIYYQLRVPLKNFLRFSRKNNLESSARQGVSLLLKITGTTSDYKISYDTKAFTNNITKDFLDEGEEWRNIKNRKKPRDEEIPELEDEYFDFEEDSLEGQ